MSSLLGENSLPGKGVGTGGDVHSGKYSATTALCMTASRMEADAFCEDIYHVATVSLQLVAAIALYTTAVNQLGMDS